MSKKDNEDSLETPLVTYSNRIQRHLSILTEILAMNNKVDPAEKRLLRLIIQNLPPKGKQALSKIYEKLNVDQTMSMKEFDEMYGEVHDWVYDHILQDAFKIKPRSLEEPHIRIEEED